MEDERKETTSVVVSVGAEAPGAETVDSGNPCSAPPSPPEEHSSVADTLSLYSEDSVVIRTPKNGSGADLVSSSSAAGLACEMCANYEFRLQSSQELERKLRQDTRAQEAQLERYKDELAKERTYRADLDAKTSQIAEASSEQVTEMFQHVVRLQDELNALKQSSKESMSAADARLKTLLAGRAEAKRENEKLTCMYEALLGKNRQQADQMRAEVIDLPQTVDELQVLCLRMHEELIEERAAREHLDESLRAEVQFMRSQLESEQNEREQLERDLSEEVNNLRTQLGLSQSKIAHLKQQLKESGKASELQALLTTKDAEHKRLLLELAECRARIGALQTELDNSETVQRDFVRLSQQLQIELEKIRAAENEVRRQHDDDVLLCNACKQPFNVGGRGGIRRKQHCYHCGRIFCANACITKEVPSGPQRRPTPVCDVCHTILSRDSAPFFSTQLPAATTSAAGSRSPATNH